MNVHGYPWGKVSYPATVDGALTGDMVPWPRLRFGVQWQTAWKPSNPPQDFFPTLATTLVDLRAPIWGELGAGPLTIPFTIDVHQTSGEAAIVMDSFMTQFGEIPGSSLVLDAPLPLVGDPKGLVTMTGHLTFDPSQAFVRDAGGQPTTQLGILLNGWFNRRLFVRTVFTGTGRSGDNSGGELTNNEVWLPFWSLLDPTAPVATNIPEGTQELACKAEVQSNNDPRPGGNVFGIHLIEMRMLTFDGNEGYAPILLPFEQPIVMRPESYSYGDGSQLPKGNYKLLLDADLLNGIEGTTLATTATEIPGGLTNVDTLDPTVIAASTAPAGVTPGYHRLTLMWIADTGSGVPGVSAENERLSAYLEIEVRIGPNPVAPPPAITVSVPNVIGLTPQAATAVLTAAGLTDAVVTSTSIIGAGNVISQSPAAHEIVDQGSLVTLTVSALPAPTVVVPNVVGLTEAQALAALTAVGLVCAVGTVAQQSPAAGTSVPVGSTVVVT